MMFLLRMVVGGASWLFSRRKSQGVEVVPVQRVQRRGFKGIRAGAVAAMLMLVTAQAAFASDPDPGPDDGVAFDGVELPFSVVGMLTTATNFLVMYWPWIALAMGVIFSPVLIGLALKLLGKARAAFKM